MRVIRARSWPLDTALNQTGYRLGWICGLFPFGDRPGYFLAVWDVVLARSNRIRADPRRVDHLTSLFDQVPTRVHIVPINIFVRRNRWRLLGLFYFLPLLADSLSFDPLEFLVVRAWSWRAHLPLWGVIIGLVLMRTLVARLFFHRGKPRLPVCKCCCGPDHLDSVCI